MAVKFIHLRLGVIGHVLAYAEAQISTPQAERLPARLILALRRAEVREGDLCQVAVQEADVSALIAYLHKLANRPGASHVERDRFLEAVAPPPRLLRVDPHRLRRALGERLAMMLIRTLAGEHIVGREAIKARVAGHKLVEDDVLMFWASADGLVLKPRDPVISSFDLLQPATCAGAKDRRPYTGEK